MFAKINLNVDTRYLNAETCRGDPWISYGGFIVTYHVKNLYRVLPPFIFKMQPDAISWFEFSHGTLPHRDNVPMVVLNVYSETCDAVTRFYDHNDDSGTQPADHQVTIFDKSRLVENGSFKAQRGESYLMNTRETHEVEYGTGKRSFIHIAWHTKPFEQVLSELNGHLEATT